MFRKEWLTSFFRPKTIILETPYHVRGVPILTGRRCTHCFLCQMICPSPGAIEVIKSGIPAVWNPQIYSGHCIRCGMCVEICPEMTIESGRIIPKAIKAESWAKVEIIVKINPVTCCGCGSCAVACPIGRKEDPILSSKGTMTSDKIILGIDSGKAKVFHEEKCTGCCICEEVCPTKSIIIIRGLEMNQGYESWDDSDINSNLVD